MAPDSDFGDLFLDMMSDTLVVYPGYIDHFGDWVASGATLSLPCHIEGEIRVARNEAGREVVSSVQALVLGNHSLSTSTHRYTLPSRFSPNDQIQAVAVEKVSDDVGPVYELVMLP